MAARPKIFPCNDVFRVECFDDLVAIARAHFRVHLDDNILVVVSLGGIVVYNRDSRHIGQTVEEETVVRVCEVICRAANQ